MNPSHILHSRRDFDAELANVQASLSADTLEALRIKWVGRKGRLQELFVALGRAERQHKAELGGAINELKAHLHASLAAAADQLLQRRIQQALATPALDVTLPVAPPRPGSQHPVTLMHRRLLQVFSRFGYQVFDGPELETDHYNFQALNIPPHHPARAMQDSFYVTPRGGAAADKSPWVLRTQTSNVQIHVMENHPPPIRIVAPGRVFRVDSDATHTPVFHQLEGLVLDTNVSIADLKGTVTTFIAEIFGSATTVRLRPSYFPFVEPGLEIDLKWQSTTGASQQRWLEVGGCGMVHPNVLEMAGYDSESIRGFAFGFGIDRLAMLAYGIDDLRQLFAGDVSWLSQFSDIR